MSLYVATCGINCTFKPNHVGSHSWQFPQQAKPLFEIKDSGLRSQYETGAQRDTSSGKGRFDLLQVQALKRVAVVLEGGAVKYDPRNWEKGIPISRMFDSAMRHLSQAIQGKQDEDHLGQAVWNLLCVMEYEERYKDGMTEYATLWHDKQYPLSPVYFRNNPNAPPAP